MQSIHIQFHYQLSIGFTHICTPLLTYIYHTQLSTDFLLPLLPIQLHLLLASIATTPLLQKWGRGATICSAFHHKYVNADKFENFRAASRHLLPAHLCPFVQTHGSIHVATLRRAPLRPLRSGSSARGGVVKNSLVTVDYLRNAWK